MIVTLTIESATHAQAETRKTYLGGQLVIGRGEDCDWRLDDPDMYLSRKHCIVTDESGQIAVIDASTGGLFIDGASTPLGIGNARRLEHHMRLRLGDFVLRVDLDEAGTGDSTKVRQKDDGFFDFGTPDPEAHRPKARPEDLPDPFGVKSGNHGPPLRDAPVVPPRPLDQRDPFALDLRSTQATPPDAPDVPDKPAQRSGGLSASSYFEDAPASSPAPVRAARTAPDPVPPIEVTRDPVPLAPAPRPASTPVSAQDGALRAALFRGLGLSEEDAARATPEEIEAIGARLRDSIDGLMFLLRTRAQEKQKIRVAQTMIANSDVNPLKFLANTDEALRALIHGRDASYLPGDKAVTAAYRDLADHQIRTWQALQTALRRMIDHFNPEEVERQMEDTGFLEKIVAGGRSAKLWQLYRDRYHDIAKAAEERFLGEVGADFRDAYETKGSEK